MLRTCVGCRNTLAKEQLVRFVADNRGHLKADIAQRALGRGVYLCPSLRCIQLVTKRGFWTKALRRRVTVDVPEVIANNILHEIRIVTRQLIKRAVQDGRARKIIRDMKEAQIEPFTILADVVREDAAFIVTDRKSWHLLTSLLEQYRRIQAEICSPLASGK